MRERSGPSGPTSPLSLCLARRSCTHLSGERSPNQSRGRTTWRWRTRPYALADGALSGVLSRLSDGWLDPDALVVIERPARGAPLLWPDGLTGIKHRRYGETMLWYGRPAG